MARVQTQPTQNPEIISPVIIDGSQQAASQNSSQYSQQSQQYNPQQYNPSQLGTQSSTPYNPTSYYGSGSLQTPSSGSVATPTSNSQVVVSSSGTPASGTVTSASNPQVVVNGSDNSSAPMVGGGPQPAEVTPTYSGSTISTSSSSISTAPPLVTSSGPGPAVSSDVVQGFANQVPLAVALRQLLPPGYGFSVDQNVDLGTLVSFRGGRPWRDTLRDALDPAGLVMHEQGQMVTISHAGSPVMASNPPPMIQPAPLPPPAPASNGPSGPQPAMLDNQPTMNVSMAPMPAAENPVINTPSLQTWTGERGDTLHKVLADWARRANVEFDWQAEYDYPLEASISFSGTFEEAVRNLLTGFEGAHPQPIAELHTNPNLGQMVLIVETRGNNYSD